MVLWRRKANEFATSSVERQTEEPAMSKMPFRVTTLLSREWLWIDSNGITGKPTFRRWSNCREFSSIYTVRELWGPEVESRSRFFQESCLFWKNDPLRGNFQIFFRNDSPPRASTCCVQISWNLADRKSVKSRIAYLTKKNFRSLSRSRLCTDRTQNLPRPAADNVLRVPQISSKSVHYRRTYSRTREHRWNAP